MEPNRITDSMLTAIRSHSNHVLYDTTIQWYRNSHDRWVPFYMNETYAELVREYPEDYRWSHTKQLNDGQRSNKNEHQYTK
jgi:hypothetical protein